MSINTIKELKVCLEKRLDWHEVVHRLMYYEVDPEKMDEFKLVVGSPGIERKLSERIMQEEQLDRLEYLKKIAENPAFGAVYGMAYQNSLDERFCRKEILKMDLKELPFSQTSSSAAVPLNDRELQHITPLSTRLGNPTENRIFEVLAKKLTVVSYGLEEA